MARAAIFSCSITGTGQNANNFVCLFADTSRDTDESDRRIVVDYAFHVTRHTAAVFTNTRNSDSVVAFRDDGADAGSITIGQGVTGHVDSGAIDHFIAAGSKCNYRCDTSAGSTGTLSLNLITSGKQGKGSKVGRLRRYNFMSVGRTYNTRTLDQKSFGYLFSDEIDTDESLVEIRVDYSMLVKRLRANVDINAKNGDSILSLRKDRADSIAITVGAGVTGEVDSGESIQTLVDAGESHDINFMIDTSASNNTGNFRVQPLIATCMCILPRDDCPWSWLELTGLRDSSVANDADFYFIYHDGNKRDIEAETQIEIYLDMVAHIIRSNSGVNSKDGNSFVTFRDDGADVVAVTHDAGTTGQDSGGFSAAGVAIESGSKCNIEIDTSASTTGSLMIFSKITVRASSR